MNPDGGSAFWSQFARKAVLHAREMERRERAERPVTKKKRDNHGFCALILASPVFTLVIIMTAFFLTPDHKRPVVFYEKRLKMCQYCQTRWCGYIIPGCENVMYHYIQRQLYESLLANLTSQGSIGPQGAIGPQGQSIRDLMDGTTDASSR